MFLDILIFHGNFWQRLLCFLISRIQLFHWFIILSNNFFCLRIDKKNSFHKIYAQPNTGCLSSCVKSKVVVASSSFTNSRNQRLTLCRFICENRYKILNILIIHKVSNQYWQFSNFIKEYKYSHRLPCYSFYYIFHVFSLIFQAKLIRMWCEKQRHSS